MKLYLQTSIGFSPTSKIIKISKLWGNRNNCFQLCYKNNVIHCLLLKVTKTENQIKLYLQTSNNNINSQQWIKSRNSELILSKTRRYSIFQPQEPPCKIYQVSSLPWIVNYNCELMMTFVWFLIRFQYSFVAATPGTNFWHSHTMFQRGDGHFGAYVVRQTSQDEAHSKLYDYDLTEHVIVAQEWFHAVSSNLKITTMKE